MVKQVKTRRTRNTKSADFSSRDLLLAGLGAMSIGRKRGIELIDNAREEGVAIQARASEYATRLSGDIVTRLIATRGRVVQLVTPLRSRALAGLAVLTERAPARLREVLVRFGLPRATRRTPARRAPAKRVTKPTTRRVAKPAATRVRNAAARKQATRKAAGRAPAAKRKAATGRKRRAA